MTDTSSLSHSKWNCKYHIVFSPKYRRQVIYQKIKADIGTILRKLCENKGVEIHAAEACPDHIHMLVSIPPHISVAPFMGCLKGKAIREYVKNQLQEDIMSDQLSFKEYIDPFTGSKNPEA